MKFILSFLIATTILSADNCVKLSIGNAALTDKDLCAPVTIFTPPTPIKCVTPLPIPTVSTIKCDLPTTPQCPPPVVTKVTPVPVICPTPTPAPIDCPKVPTNPVEGPQPGTPTGPSTATPEPGSMALVGAGLVTAGVARKFRKNK